MPMGFRDDRRRRRRRFQFALLRWLLALAAIVGAGVYAYQTGVRLAEKGVVSRDEQIRSLGARVDELQAQAQTHRAELAAERARADDWRQRYERDVATGEVKGLFDLVQAKLAAGVDAQRLRWVLERTGPKRDCDPRPQVRRVAVQTPISRGPAVPAAFAGGAVGVSLLGASARDAAGNPEAWFDPKQPVTIRLTRPGGKPTETQGLLPQQQSLIEGDREYRLAVVVGSRGFAQVSVERCRFP
jgi:cell division protein FtsB